MLFRLGANLEFVANFVLIRFYSIFLVYYVVVSCMWVLCVIMLNRKAKFSLNKILLCVMFLILKFSCG